MEAVITKHIYSPDEESAVIPSPSGRGLGHALKNNINNLILS